MIVPSFYSNLLAQKMSALSDEIFGGDKNLDQQKVKDDENLGRLCFG